MSSKINQDLSREQLYDLVWSTPSTQIAAQLGISDVALSKRCKREGVPKPSSGYWPQVAAGKKPPKKPLPQSPSQLLLEALRKPVGSKKRPFPGRIELYHPIAQELFKVANEMKPGSDGRVCVCTQHLPHLKVSPKKLSRAVRFIEDSRPQALTLAPWRFFPALSAGLWSPSSLSHEPAQPEEL